MISRIVEARPEELRIFLEEAAGISKYKERRRETENRLADTRDNLTRVEDILRELDAQIERLEQQAEVAQTYRDMQAAHDEQQQMLWLLASARPTPSVTRSSRDIRGAVDASRAISRNCAALSASSRTYAPRITARAMPCTRRRAGCCRSTPKWPGSSPKSG